jgi:hypothetical protein
VAGRPVGNRLRVVYDLDEVFAAALQLFVSTVDYDAETSAEALHKVKLLFIKR